MLGKDFYINNLPTYYKSNQFTFLEILGEKEKLNIRTNLGFLHQSNPPTDLGFLNQFNRNMPREMIYIFRISNLVSQIESEKEK